MRNKQNHELEVHCIEATSEYFSRLPIQMSFFSRGESLIKSLKSPNVSRHLNI